MIAYRIHKSKYRWDDSEGARLHGGRWNPPGIAAIYAASHVSLAVLEILVHYNAEDPDEYSVTKIEIPQPAEIVQLSLGYVAQLQARSKPDPEALLDDEASFQEYGKRWSEEFRSLVLSVPSAILPDWPNEQNYVINPAHADFHLLKFQPAKPFTLDPRLIT